MLGRVPARVGKDVAARPHSLLELNGKTEQTGLGQTKPNQTFMREGHVQGGHRLLVVLPAFACSNHLQQALYEPACILRVQEFKQKIACVREIVAFQRKALNIRDIDFIHGIGLRRH
jgi:hypothetical protein